MERVKCNLCGSGEADLVGVFQDAAFGLPGRFPYVRCRQCGLIYLQERPTPAEMAAYYPPDYQPFRTAIQDERWGWMRWARQRNIRQFCRLVEQANRSVAGRVLDVGCSTGIFLEAMRQLGWNGVGVETNPEAAQFARQRFGLEVFQGQLLEAGFAAGQFDVLTLWNVLEHLFDPLETLGEAHRLLREGGLLVMVFPRWESLDRRLFGESWIGFDAPRHLYVYPRPVYERFLQTTGFDLLQTGTGPLPYFATAASLETWLKTHLRWKGLRQGLMKLVNFPGARFLAQPALAVVHAFGRGATTLVIARKSAKPIPNISSREPRPTAA